MKNAWISLAAVCALVVGVYAYTAHSGFLVSTSLNPADSYYNLLIQGFRAGQLSLKKELPPGFAQLADPYDRTANTRYGVLDLSYYKGRFHLYFGVTPAVVLFWPYVALTGHYLLQKDAVVIFCVVGFLVSVGLVWAMWRRYFAEVNVAVVAAGAVALGLATFTPVLLARSDVYEVSIGCGYALTMLALAAMWKAVHEPERRCWWLAAASLAYGLAVGARPSLLFGAVILLAPVVQTWRERRRVWAPLLAATAPIILIGLGLMFYNALRFNNPFEFGGHYQLAGQRLFTQQFFSLRYLWFNFRVLFLEPAHWSGRSPFVHDITLPPLPVGHGRVEHPFGVLTNVPLVWLALAVPLAWRGRSADVRSTLCGFLAAVGILFGICALILCLFFAVCTRYEAEFLPALVLLAVVGILGLERTLAPTPESGQAGRPRHQMSGRAVRWGWGLLLGFSVVFNLLASVEYCAEADCNYAVALQQLGKVPEAIVHYEQALRLNPDYAEAHNNLGNALLQTGKIGEAIPQCEQALRIRPDYAEAHNNLGIALMGQGRLPEAIGHYEQALHLEPNYADPHYNLGLALIQAGKVEEAIGHYEQALRLKPDNAEAHNSLGNALIQTGKAPEAISHWEQAVRIKPDFADAHYNLGLALIQAGKVQEAIEQYEQALRLKPDNAEAHYNLGNVLIQAGKVQEAISHWEQALRIKPDLAEARNNLGTALYQTGKLQEAIGHYEQALRVKPGYADAHYNLGNALIQAGKVQEAIQHYEQALRIKPDFTQAQTALARLQASH
ncbi:MAG: tetratricopeptide repeat protein [Verrucomicrobiia bacterium]